MYHFPLRYLFACHDPFCLFLGELLDSANLKGLTGTINVDDTRKYKLDARIQVDQTKDRMTYTPIINIEIPDWKNVQLNGVLNYQKMKVFDADLTMEGVTDEPVIFQSRLIVLPLPLTGGQGHGLKSLSYKQCHENTCLLRCFDK